MKIFLDTSSLVKLYKKEAGTLAMQNLLLKNNVNTIFLSEITKIEFASALLKKARVKDMTEADAKLIIKGFERDSYKYQFVPVSYKLVELARLLMLKYGIIGLRTLDSIQFAVAVSLKNDASLFVTSDNLLESFFRNEGLPV